MRRARTQAASAGLVPLAARPLPTGGRLLAGERPDVVRRRRTRRWRWGRYLVLAVAAYCAWTGHVDWILWHRLAGQAASLSAQAAALRQRQAALHADIAYAGTNAYVESQARQEFGLVGPGEVPLAPVTASATPAAPSAPVGGPPAGGSNGGNPSPSQGTS